MRVVILCGGQGTRLREETEFRPKPLVEIGGRPILWHIMKIYGHHGFKDFVLCLGYRGNMIKDFFLNYEPMNSDFTISLGAPHRLSYHGAHDEQDFRVTLSDTGLDAMTGSRIARVRRYLEGDPAFLVTYGDGVSDIDLRALVEFHRSHGKLATVTTVRPTSRFGVLDVDPLGRVLSFAEKPQLDGRVSAGFFVFNRAVVEYLSEDSGCVLEREPMEHLVKEGQLVAYQHDGFFQAMDTYREFKTLNELWESGRAPWKVW
jgi:glucose-1-phosphate cytidylyltransferase